MNVFLPATAVMFFIGRILGGPDGQTERERRTERKEGQRKKIISLMVSEAGCGILGIKLRGDREGRWGEGRGQKRKKACRGVGRERI